MAFTTGAIKLSIVDNWRLCHLQRYHSGVCGTKQIMPVRTRHAVPFPYAAAVASGTATR